jgi:hypothetical protein
VGDSLNIQGEVMKVAAVNSDTSLTMTAVATSTATGTAYHTKSQFIQKWYLSGVGAEVVAPRIQYRVILNSSNAAQSPFVRSVSFWYLPEPEPNWVWDIVVLIGHSVELLDMTYETQNIETQLSTLAEYFRDQRIITFTDREGREWDALIWDYNEDFHVPGKAGEPKENILRLTILEVSDE